MILEISMWRIFVSPPKLWGRSRKGRRKGIFFQRISAKSTIPANWYAAEWR